LPNGRGSAPSASGCSPLVVASLISALTSR
jgi:hypothetical protein